MNYSNPAWFLALVACLMDPASTNDEAGTCSKPHGSLTSNPTSALFPANFADPCIIKTSGKYYAFATNHKPVTKGGPYVNVPIATSNDFTKGWEFLADKTDVLPDPGEWAIKNSDGNAQVGAPDVSKIVRQWRESIAASTRTDLAQNETHYVMYYSAKAPSVPGNKDRKCVGVAHASSVMGPYKALEKALACPSEGVIGPSGVEFNGQRYLLYKIGGHFDKTHTAHIHIRKLAADGLNWAPGSESVSLLNNTKAEYDTEGPNMTVSSDGQTYFLWFVTGFFRDANYAIRYITGPSPEGPFKNDDPAYLLRTGETNGVFVLAPGGPDFVDSTHMSFLATKPNATCGTGGTQDPETRHMHAAVLEYDEDEVKVAGSNS